MKASRQDEEEGMKPTILGLEEETAKLALWSWGVDEAVPEFAALVDKISINAAALVLEELRSALEVHCDASEDDPSLSIRVEVLGDGECFAYVSLRDLLLYDMPASRAGARLRALADEIDPPEQAAG
jgi:hypothetical protein